MEKTILFMGGDTQTGTTMLSLAAAEELAGRDKRVLYISTGFCAGDEYLPRNLVGVSDELITGLMADELSGEELKNAAVNIRGVDVLKGTRLTEQGHGFLPDDLQTICSLAEKFWDWILIDGGILLGRIPAAAYAELAGQIWIVVTQQEKSIDRYLRWKSAETMPAGKPLHFVLNKYNDSGAFYTIKETAEMLNCTEYEIVPVPYVPYGWQAETERSTLRNFRRFRKAVHRLAEYIEEGDCDGIESRSTL